MTSHGVDMGHLIREIHMESHHGLDHGLDIREFYLMVRRHLKIPPDKCTDNDILSIFHHLDPDGSGEIMVEEILDFMSHQEEVDHQHCHEGEYYMDHIDHHDN